MKTCPYCAEQIQDAAIVCRFCNRNQPRTVAPQATGPKPTAASSFRLVLKLFALAGALVLVGIVLLFVFLSMESGSSAPTLSASEKEALLKRQIYNAILMDPDRAAISKRYGKSLEDLRAIEAEGKKSGWKLENVNPPSKPTPTASDPMAESRAELLDKLQTAGLIVKRTCVGNEAQINPLGWLALDADGKKNVTAALAAWCEDQRSGNRMTIIDARSGRKLAEIRGGSYTVY